MVSNDPPTRSLQDQLADIHLLIDRRNLNRSRDLAQTLLLHYPNSAPVHAALGEIAAASHEHREAIEWYELALRLQHTPQWQDRLDRERDLLDEEHAEQYLDSISPERDNRRLLVAAVAGGFVVVALLVLLVVGIMGRGGREPEKVGGRAAAGRSATRPGTPAGSVPRAGAAGARPATRPGAGSSYPGGGGVTGGVAAGSPEYSAAPSGPGVRMTQNVEAPMTDQDVLLTRSLASLNWPAGDPLGRYVQAVVDPFTHYAMVTLQLPPGTRRADLYPLVIDMAYRLAVATVQAEPGVDALTVRVLAEVEGQDRRQRLLVAFRANTSRESLEYYLKRGVQPDRDTIWKHVFATTWWNPSVPTGAEPES